MKTSRLTTSASKVVEVVKTSRFISSASKAAEVVKTSRFTTSATPAAEVVKTSRFRTSAGKDSEAGKARGRDRKKHMPFSPLRAVPVRSRQRVLSLALLDVKKVKASDG